MELRLKIIVLVAISIGLIKGQLDEGDRCTLNNNLPGVCKLLMQCDSVYEALQAGIVPTEICGYSSFEPIVCCGLDNTDNVPSSPSSPSSQPSPQQWGDTDSKWRPPTRHPIRDTNRPNWSQTSTTTTTIRYSNTEVTNWWGKPLSNEPGAIAAAKCTEYSRALYTLVIPPTLSGNSKPVNQSLCAIKSQKLIVGGIKAAPKEFPHMANIGFEPTRGEIDWTRCAGTLISENFVLTAAHCMYTPELGEASWIKVGDLDLSTERDNAKPQIRRVVQRITHPEYKKPLEYNDIALLKMERPVTFDAYVRPACLPTLRNNIGTKAIASGWGRVDWTDDEGSAHLLKVTLPIVSHRQCNESFFRGGTDYKLKFGILDDSQLCAGETGKDTCQGDSGGPLVVFNKQHKCMYDVIGITSLGRICGSIIPGVYTRVSHFVPWIESTVW